MSPELERDLRYIAKRPRGENLVVPSALNALGNLEIRQMCGKLRLAAKWDEHKREFVIQKEE